MCREVTLGEICTRIGDGLHGTPQYDPDGEYYFFNGSNIVNGRLLVDSNTKRVNHSEYLKYKKDLSERTILLSINGTIGNTAIYNGEKCILGKSAAYLNIGNDANPKFVYYLLNCRAFQLYLTNANGSTIKNVSLEMLREYSFELPDLIIQDKIVTILESIDSKINVNLELNAKLGGTVVVF